MAPWNSGTSVDFGSERFGHNPEVIQVQWCTVGDVGWKGITGSPVDFSVVAAGGPSGESSGTTSDCSGGLRDCPCSGCLCEGSGNTSDSS